MIIHDCTSCLFADIDECARGFCSHGCQNLIGSFKCTCRAGFRLSADGTTCFGEIPCDQSRFHMCGYACRGHIFKTADNCITFISLSQ